MGAAYRVLLTALLFVSLLPRDTAFGQTEEPNPYSWITEKHTRPFLELCYGPDWPRHKTLGTELPSIGALELRGGLHYIDTLENRILYRREGLMLVSWDSKDLGGSGAATPVTVRLFRFGFGNSRGYGYDLDGSSIIPYVRLNSSLTRLTTDRSAGLSAADKDILDRYEGSFRFGLSGESGIRANLGRAFSLSGGYEASVIYPRLVFWRWLGSSAIAGAADGIVSFVGRKILDVSPAVGPVLIFVLKSAVLWGTYQLWRTEMNWPFASETPLTHETLGFSLGYTF